MSKNILITGASRGIGAAIAYRFATIFLYAAEIVPLSLILLQTT